MEHIERFEMIVSLSIAIFFWLYVLAGVSAMIAAVFSLEVVMGFAGPFLETFIVYVFVASFFLLFWPETHNLHPSS
jgi:hypothetical protein